MSRRRHHHRARPSSSLRVESLEPRVVLSATVEFDAARRLLEITGTDADDAVEIRQEGRELSVTVDGTVAATRPIRGVRSIVFNGLAGNDTFVNASRVRVIADGGEGDDLLQGGFRGDRLSGGPGYDRLRGEGGNDLLSGGADDDSLSGGRGHDRLWGDDGDDHLDGGEGRDFQHGGAGLDVEDDFNDRFRDGDRDRDGYDDDHDRPVDAGIVTPVTFDANGQAQVTGTSQGERNRIFYGFTAAENGTLAVSLAPDANGRSVEVEVRDVTLGRELLDLEPHENGAVSGTVPVFAGNSYILRLKAPSRAAVDYAVSLSIDATTAPPVAPITPPVGSPTIGSAIVFDANGQAQVTGTSRFDDDPRFYSFTAPADGIVDVSLAPGANGRYAELEIKDAATRRELLELEPHERPWQTTGRVAVRNGQTYVLKLESPFERAAVDFTVNLALR
jgi:hypothetical protein